MMLLSTGQMSDVQRLDKNRPAITNITNSDSTDVNVSKLFGVHFHQHLNWNEHVWKQRASDVTEQYKQ